MSWVIRLQSGQPRHIDLADHMSSDLVTSYAAFSQRSKHAVITLVFDLLSARFVYFGLAMEKKN